MLINNLFAFTLSSYHKKLAQSRKRLEQKAEKIHKEAKGYLESMHAMSTAQLKIAETINQFYEDSSEPIFVGNKYKETVELIDHNCRTYLDEPYKHTVTNPIGRFCAYFPEINEAIKKRDKKLLDYDAQRAKVRKLVDKSDKSDKSDKPEDSSKLLRAEEALNETRLQYESLNGQLVEELPKLIDLRVPYIDPSFEALVKIQLKFCQESYDRLNDLQKHFPDSDNKVETVLQQMKELSICGMI
ncbi:10812_t:CDS:2 [Entrophospora sp. SA101]|nr:10812_t:CDS:2 [Entrophospora sp. SA101]CAJ0826727.1 1321_t:CDS:2 [Entrophospora sp. SA101]CAJ0826741.1 1326_t:CDS:2 [Entrophospora sp. SA101]CAJ0830121.1 16494_t:CDS:2 [Entrophospora sp. SA101]